MDSTQARHIYEQCLRAMYIDRDPERMGEFCAPHIRVHPTPPGVPSGLVGLQEMMRAWMHAFSDSRFTIELFVHEQGRVASRLVVNALHSGAFLGIPASGQRVDIVDHPHLRIEDGKITEFWSSPDMMSLLHQLGALPAPSKAA